MNEVVQRSIEDGVAVLTLNRPERLNAWTAEMERTYFDLLAAERDEVRAIVVTGAGRGFCAGADMQELQSIGDDGVDAAARDGDGRLERGLEESVADANRLMLESFSQPDFAEGVASFLERREPRFAPFGGEREAAGAAS
jgi:enoyl-CoA hydratase/carnithine racemase